MEKAPSQVTTQRDADDVFEQFIGSELRAITDPQAKNDR